MASRYLTTEGVASCSSIHRYEVFLSFRGEDTRFNFTDHLCSHLRGRGIETFIDDELRRGEEISWGLLKAIEESRVSIIIFSQNYASSRWCLDELVKILECRKSQQQEVRPVFYKVDPSDVRNQTGCFGDAFATLDQCKYKDSLPKWRSALKQAAELSGWPVREGESEAKLIQRIAGELSRNGSCELYVAEHPVGLESYRQDVIRLLDAEENIVVGIWGPGGAGKTTIAKDVFNSIHRDFEANCFLADVRSNEIAKLQKALLRNILRDPEVKVRSVDEGVSWIRRKMRNKKVLLILDDVSHITQLQNLVPSPDCFGPGSRILITTRDKRWLVAHQANEVYEVKMLNDCQALELFSLNAFKRIGPPGNYLELAQRAVRYAQGLPLALIILGSHLFCRSMEEWEDTLDSCRGEGPHREIRDVLKVSYDALGVDLKAYFLDIACFFKGKHVDDVKPILEACYDLKSVIGFAQLQEKALISIKQDEMKNRTIWMHDLLEEMGKDIVYQESPDEPGERSRLWSEEDVDHVLTNNTGTNKVIGIQVPWRSSRMSFQQQSSTISLNAKSFSGMKNLRYISMGDNLEFDPFSGDIDYVSNQLRWLDWPNSPFLSFPSGFYANKLVKFNITDSSRINRLWEGRKKFSRLTYMSLRGCKSLTQLPDLSEAPNLEELILGNCENLTTLPYNIYKLQNLQALKVKDCPKLATFPEIPTTMGSLRFLILSGSGIRELDQSIGNLIVLEWLDLSGCNNLTTLPGSIYGLQNLTELCLKDCSNLVRLPPNTNILDVDGGSLSLPKLEGLSICGCSLSDCDFLMTLNCQETLDVLDLSYNDFVSLPRLSEFVNLETLELDGCERLKEIPELPPNVCLSIDGCKSLKHPQFRII